MRSRSDLLNDDTICIKELGARGNYHQRETLQLALSDSALCWVVWKRYSSRSVTPKACCDLHQILTKLASQRKLIVCIAVVAALGVSGARVPLAALSRRENERRKLRKLLQPYNPHPWLRSGRLPGFQAQYPAPVSALAWPDPPASAPVEGFSPSCPGRAHGRRRSDAPNRSRAPEPGYRVCAASRREYQVYTLLEWKCSWDSPKGKRFKLIPVA